MTPESRPAPASVRGVGAVARVGGVDREVRVELDPMRMLALAATAADVSRQLRQTQQEASGGRADVGGVEQSVRTIGTVQSAAELARMDIVLTDGRRVRLEQLASVTDTVAEQRSAALLDGKPVVGFEITRSRGAGELEVANGVRAELAKLKAEHPDISIVESFNFVDPVEENYTGSMWLLIEGALLAVFVVWLFLRDWRATAISAVALPLSIIPTFWAIWALGYTLNILTLLALSLVMQTPGENGDDQPRGQDVPEEQYEACGANQSRCLARPGRDDALPRQLGRHVMQS